MTTIINKGKIGLEDLFLADSPEYPSAEFSRTGQISTSTLHKIPNIFYSGEGSFFDTDGTLADNSDNKSATQKAIKTYVDNAVSDAAYGSGWNNITTIAPSKNAVYDYLATLGTAAFLNVGTSASQVVQLDASAKLPAVDGSQLTNVSSGDMGYSDTRFSVEVATRSTATASGDVNYTGAGFTPTAIIVIGGDQGTAGYEASTGFGSGASSQACFSTDNGRLLIGYNDKVFFFEEVGGAGKQQHAAIAAFLSNGVTLTWTKVGSPSTVDLTLYIFYMR